ncbi:GntR family transcriptional regulator [Paenibacillus sp. 1P07SE]|uniref:GntR family transcriptional regulator n=1 Tax=Paenibacillus sp. 1P07SE TaxID=3132209 RepID=UPI0039A54BBC
MTFSPVDPPERQSLGTRVYEQIREVIVSLQAEPGSMLYENELAAALRVSRTPIREAIRMLAGEKLIEVLPQRGTRIARISVARVAEARFVREQLEEGAFRQAASLWPLADRSLTEQRLTELLEKQRLAAQAGDMYGFLLADEAFHRQIMAVAGNAMLQEIIDQVRAHINRMRLLSMREFRHMEHVMEEHMGLLEALRRGDEEQTAARLKVHIGKLEEELPELIARYPHFFEEEQER